MLFMTHAPDGGGGAHEADEDTPLVHAAQGGDMRAFERLMRKYERLVYRTAYYASGTVEDAADLSQEIWLRVWRGISSYRGESRFLTWLLRIARNACVDHLRKKQRTPPTQPLDVPMDDGADNANREPADLSEHTDPHAVLNRRENADLVRAAMERLSREHRILLVMRDVEGLPYERIAQALELELGTVKSRLARARSQLKTHLTDLGFFD